MALQLGLVGLPNVGKSTLFNALTQAGAAVANYPFTTIEPNIGVVPVPDPRMQRIAAIIQPEKVTPATLRVVDIAGLVKGASQGEGLGNQFLAHIRGVDALAMVVRCFLDENVPHVTPTLDPAADVETVLLELILDDLALLERQQERVQTRAKGHAKEFEDQLTAIDIVLAGLRAGQPARQLKLEPEQWALLSDAALLTARPLVLVANVSEGDLPEGGALAGRVRAQAEAQGAEAIVLCAQLESELCAWPAADATAYLAEVGLHEPGLNRFIGVGYRLLDYITFFTTTGGKEVRAWTLRRGQTALEAAGAIHTDMAHGFIRAEVVSYDQLDAAGSIARARDVGHLRLEGRDYVVQDGDVIHIRFAV
jgi:hypothetical protein